MVRTEVGHTEVARTEDVDTEDMDHTDVEDMDHTDVVDTDTDHVTDTDQDSSELFLVKLLDPYHLITTSYQLPVPFWSDIVTRNKFEYKHPKQ